MNINFKNLLVSGLVGVLSFILIVAFSPWFKLVEASVDEGMNLAKAALLGKGVGPYGAVWNDQGPVLTIILAVLQKVAPWNVEAARMVTAGFAAIILANIHLLVKAQRGSVPALASVMLLGTSCLFVRLASSVMIGLPAISLAVCALSIILIGAPKMGRVLISAIMFAAALQTKLFVFTLMPAFLIALATIQFDKRRLMTLWIIACSGCFFAINLIEGQDFLENLVRPHLTMTPQEFSYPPSQIMIAKFAQLNPLLTTAGLISLSMIIIRIKKANRHDLIAVTWLIVATIVLLAHFPVWDHQLLLLAVPLAWLGGPVIASVVDKVTRFLKLPLFRQQLTVSIFTTGGIIVCASLGFTSVDKKFQTALQGDIDALAEFSGLGGTVATDRAMLAFRAKLSLPPELAVWSSKRIQIGQINDQEIIKVIKRDKPAQVLLQRFPVSKALMSALIADYVQTSRTYNAIHLIARKPEVNTSHGVALNLLGVLRDGMLANGIQQALAPRHDALGTPQSEGGDKMGAGSIWMRPPGAAYEIGTAFLDAYKVTHDSEYLVDATQVALNITRTQLCSGGWTPEANSVTKCEHGIGKDKASFDEGMQAGALRFLLRLNHHCTGKTKAQITAAIERGLGFLLAAQNSDGGWPLVPGASNYRGISSLNDDVTPSHITILLDAWSQYHDTKLLASAQRGLDFLLDVQLSSGAWAQQYSPDGAPAAARAFEPAAASSLETSYAIMALLDAYIKTGDVRLIQSAAKGAQWLKSVRTGPQEWARFYEIETDRPVFGDRDGSIHYSFAEISPERQSGYRWMGHFVEVQDAIALVDVTSRGGSAAYFARQRDLSLIHELSLMARKDDAQVLVHPTDTKVWLDFFYRQIGNIWFSR